MMGAGISSEARRALSRLGLGGAPAGAAPFLGDVGVLGPSFDMVMGKQAARRRRVLHS